MSDEQRRNLAVALATLDELAEAERAFLEASIAVWREVDAQTEANGGRYLGLPQSTDVRIAERAAWERYRAQLDAPTVVEEWRVVDRWWTAEPIAYEYRALSDGRVERRVGGARWEDVTPRAQDVSPR